MYRNLLSNFISNCLFNDLTTFNRCHVGTKLCIDVKICLVSLFQLCLYLCWIKFIFSTLLINPRHKLFHLLHRNWGIFLNWNLYHVWIFISYLLYFWFIVALDCPLNFLECSILLISKHFNLFVPWYILFSLYLRLLLLIIHNRLTF